MCDCGVVQRSTASIRASLISWQVSWQMSHLLYHFYHSIFPFSIHSRSWSPLPTALPVPVNFFLNSVKRPAVTCQNQSRIQQGTVWTSEAGWWVIHMLTRGPLSHWRKSVHGQKEIPGDSALKPTTPGALSTAVRVLCPDPQHRCIASAPPTPHWVHLEPLVTGPGKGSAEEVGGAHTPRTLITIWATAPRTPALGDHIPFLAQNGHMHEKCSLKLNSPKAPF